MYIFFSSHPIPPAFCLVFFRVKKWGAAELQLSVSVPPFCTKPWLDCPDLPPYRLFSHSSYKRLRSDGVETSCLQSLQNCSMEISICSKIEKKKKSPLLL